MSTNLIIGSKFNYSIDREFGLQEDGYIATGTESIVYKGWKFSSKDSEDKENYEDGKVGQIQLSCVLKFKYKSVIVGDGENGEKVFNVLERFKNNDLKLFNDLQSCRSVVRIYDVIEDLGDFELIDNHVDEGDEPIRINAKNFFCVVEEYVDGWSLEEYCRDQFWGLTRVTDDGNNNKRKVSFHEFEEVEKQKMLEAYQRDYENVMKYQSEVLGFMQKLCEILKFIAGETKENKKRILHLDIKPDNIMVTKHGRDIVLIDFGRSEYIPNGIDYVQNQLSGADYSKEEKFERVFQYGTFGYAAPECFVEALNGSQFPFEEQCIARGEMRVESDIFSFGATFWECLNVFELYTGSKEFAKNKAAGGYSDFYHKYLLNPEAYFDRDLSLTSQHYHEKLENLIKKCTKRRTKAYGTQDKKAYYRSYADLENAIAEVQKSIPARVKAENIAIRNACGVAGVFSGLGVVLWIALLIMNFFGAYFANQKYQNISEGYRNTQIAFLESAALERMEFANELEKHVIYNETQQVLYKANRGEEAGFNGDEVEVLVNLLKEVDDTEFIGESVDQFMAAVESNALAKSISYTVENLDDSISSDGFQLAVHIYNAQGKESLLDQFKALQAYSEQGAVADELQPLVRRLADTLNHEEQRTKLAQQLVKTEEYKNKDVVQIKRELQDYLETIN